jgi:hypothetical protein
MRKMVTSRVQISSSTVEEKSLNIDLPKMKKVQSQAPTSITGLKKRTNMQESIADTAMGDDKNKLKPVAKITDI